MSSANPLESHLSAFGGNQIHPVDTETLGQRVYNELRNFLMSGGVPPGEKVTLRQLTSAFGTSLMPVREAVQRLVAEGALELLPNRAIRVPLMTKARVTEILRIRLALEGMAVEEAARIIRPETVDHLEALNNAFCDDMKTSENRGHQFGTNRDFHFTIYRAAEMPVLMGMIEKLWVQVGPFLHFSLGVRHREEGSKYAPDCHNRLIQALRQRDGKAGCEALAGDLRGAVDLMFRFGNLPD